MSKNGYIVLDRRIMEWEHFKDHKTYTLFTVLLMLAEYEDRVLPDGTELKRGQLATSLQELADKSFLTVKEVRARIWAMERTKEILNVSSRKNRIITVLNYDRYQLGNDDEGKEMGKEMGKDSREKEEKREKEKQKERNKEEIRDIKKFLKNGRARANIIKSEPNFDIESIERAMSFETPKI